MYKQFLELLFFRIWLPYLEKRGQACLTFNYNMYGFHISLLEMVIKRADGKTDVPFQMEGQQGRDWKPAAANFYLDYGDRVREIYLIS